MKPHNCRTCSTFGPGCRDCINCSKWSPRDVKVRRFEVIIKSISGVKRWPKRPVEKNKI